MRSYYEVLGTTPSVSAADLKIAFRRKVKEWHPDVNSHRLEEANKRIREIYEAWEVLGDPETRRDYDAFLSQPRATHTSYTEASAWGQQAQARAYNFEGLHMDEVLKKAVHRTFGALLGCVGAGLGFMAALFVAFLLVVINRASESMSLTTGTLLLITFLLIVGIPAIGYALGQWFVRKRLVK